MKVLMFRRYKRLDEEELLDQIYDAFELLKTNKQQLKENMELCDQLIREAKHRKLSCSKEVLYDKIMYR
ncbi:MAG: hypothetical protein ACOYVK_17765 [Bacillota bacterium]